MGFVPQDDEFDVDAAAASVLDGSYFDDPPIAPKAPAKPRWAGKSALTQAELEDVLREAGWDEKDVPRMSAIGMAEAALTPDGRAKIDSYNPGIGPGGRPTVEESIGPWQINMHPSLGRKYDRKRLASDPVYNAKAALDIYKEQGLRAWGAYTNGRYKKHYKKTGQVGPAAAPFDPDKAAAELLRGIPGFDPEVAVPGPVTETAATLDAQRQAARDPQSTRIAVLYTDGATAPELEVGEYDVQLPNGQILRADAVKLTEYLKTTGTALADIRSGAADFTPLIGGKAEPTGEQYGTEGQVAVISYDEDGNELISSSITDPANIPVEAALQKKQFPGRKIRTEVGTAADVINAREPVAAEDDGFAEANAFLVSQGQPQLTREEFDARSQNFGSDVEVDSYQIRSGDQSDELQQVAPKRPSNSSAPQPKVAGKIGGGIYRNVAVKQTDLRDATDPNQYASQQAAYAMADELGVSRSTADEWLAKKGYNILQNGGFTEYEVSLAEEGKSVNININNSLAKEFAKFAGKEKDFVPNIEIGEFDDLTKVTKAIDQMMYSQQNIEPLRTEEEAEESISKRIKDKDYSATQWASEILSNPLNLVFTPALMYNVATKETVSDEWQQQEKKRLKDQYGSFKSADVAEKYYQGMSWGETAVRFTGQVARSFAKNLVGGTGKSIAYLGQITEDVNPLNKALPGELKVGLRNMVNAADFIAHLLTAPDLASAQKDMKWAGPEEVNKQQLFRAMEEFDKTVGDDPVIKGRLLGSFADAGGSALAFVALGAAAPSLGTSKLLGFTLDRSTALIGGLQMAGAGYEEAKKAGLSETDARFHGLTSFLLGGTEALGAGADLIKLLRSGAAKKAGIEKQLIGGLLEVAKKKAKAIGTKVAAEAKQEFAQEVFQTTAGGAVLEYLKDNDPSTLKKLTNALNRLPKQFGSAVANEGLIALVTGGLMGGATATAQQLANKMAGVEEKGNPVPVNPAILGDFSEKGRQEFFAAVDEKLAGLVADGEITQVDADGAAARAREIANMSPKKAIQAMQEILEAPATEVATEEPVPAEKLTGSRVDRYVPEVTAVNETGLSTITDKEGTEFTVLEDRGEKGLLVQDSKGAQKIWPERKFNAGDLAAIREAGLKSVPVDQGETRVVYRLGWANETDPSGRYVGDADRVAAHINKTEEGMKGAGDTLFAYRVPVSELLWDKQNLGNAAILPEGSKAKLISQTPYADQYGTGKAKTGEEWSMFEVAGDHIRKTFKQEKQAPPTRFSTPKINTVSQIKKGAIPEDPWAWFNRDVYDAAPAISTMVDPDKVILTKSRERMDRDEVAFGGKHELVRAYNHLLDQADGSPQGRKRDPIEVYKNEDGTFTVADGNATVQLAQMLGWKQVPAVITKKPIGTVAPVNEKIAQLSRDVLNEAEGLKHDYFRDVRQAAAVAGGFVPATIRQYLTKSIKSLNKKLALKSGAVPTDLIRSTIVIPTGSPADAEARAAKVVEAMGRLGYKVLKDEKGQPDVTNRFADPAPGYKDIAIKFVKDDSPAVHELQLLQPATFTAKTGIWVDPVKGQYRTTKRLAQHINYDKVKDLQDAIANDPFLTPRRVKDLLADIVEINAAMAKAYAASFAKDTGLRASDSSTYRPSETIDASSLSSTGTPSKSRNRKNASGDVLSEVVAKNLATDSLSSTERALKFFNDSDIYTSSSIVADDESNSKGLESPLKKVDPDRTGSALGVFTEPKVEKGRSAQKAVATITKHMRGSMATPIKEATNAEIEDAFYRNALADLQHWIANYKDGYTSFYGDDVAKANDMLQAWAKQAHGSELTAEEVDLFHLLGSLSASGVEPREDSALATIMLDRYLRDGTISAKDPMRFRPEFVGGKPTGNIRFESDPDTGRSVVGTGRYSTKVHPESLNAFSRVLAHFKGDLKKTMTWVNSPHPLQELLDVSGQSELPTHEYLDAKNGGKGVFSLFSGTGAKLGSYYLNRVGDLSTVTKDMWYGRGEARYLGLPLAHKDGSAIGGPLESKTVYGRRARVAEDAAVARLAKQFKVEPAIIQQWLWDFEQRLWDHAGMPATRLSYISEGVTDGIKRLETRSAAGERAAATVGVGVVREGTGKTIKDTIAKFAQKAYREALATNDRILKAFNVHTSGTAAKFTVLNLHQQQNTIGVWEGTSASMEESALYTVSGPTDLVKAFAVTASILAPNPQQAVMLDTYDRNGEGDETHITFRDLAAIDDFVANRAKYNAGNLSLNPTTKTVIIVHNRITDDNPLRLDEVIKDYAEQVTNIENRAVVTDFIDESQYRGALQEARDSVQRHYPGKRGESINKVLDEADARLRREKPDLYEDAPLKSVAPPKTAKIADLVLDPAGVSVAKATYLWQGGRSTNTNPIAVEVTPDGKYHVLDGYHRVAQAKRDGKDEIAIRVVELVGDKYEDVAAPLKSVSGPLLAPNGKPSNLNARQWKEVRTPEFLAYFGDWINDPENASKVVDENGEPKVLLHGSEASEIEEFQTGESVGRLEPGIFLTDDAATADFFASKDLLPSIRGRYDQEAFDHALRTEYEEYGQQSWMAQPTVYPVFVNMRRPRRGTKDEIDIIDATEDIENAKDWGLDGLIVDGVNETGDSVGTTYVVFEPNQIKSAIGNRGTFDANEDSILKKARTAESRQLRMELELADTDEVVKRLSGGTLHTNGELELNEADAELLRRLIAERYFQRTGKTIDEMPFDGIMWNSAYMRNLAQFGLTTGREQLVEAGFTEDQIAKADELMNKLIETADTNEGHAIAYVYDEALPHERTHKEERGLGGVPKGVEAKLLALPIAQTVGTAFDRAYPNISSQDKVSELAAIIATGDAAKYGLSTDTAAQQEFLHMWARGIIDNNIEQINEIGPQAWAAQYPIISGIAFATSQGEQNAENNQSAEVGTARDQETGGSSAISGAGVQGAAGRAQAAGQEQAPASQTANSEQGQPPVSPDAEIAQLTGQTVTEVKTKNRQFAQSLASSLFDIGNVEYEPQTVKGWEDGAAETIEEKGLDGAIDEYRKMPAGSSEGRKTALGVAIAVEMYADGRTDDLVTFGRELTENVGNAAQELRAAALLSRLSPAFAAITGDKIVMKAKGRAMDGQERAVVDKLARELEEAADGHAFAQAALAEAKGLNEKFAERVKELEAELAAARTAPSGNAAANEKALADALALAEEYKRKLDAGAIKVKGPKALKDLRVKIEGERPDLVALLQQQFPGTSLKLPAHHGTPHVFKAELLVEYPDGKREFIEGDVDKMPAVPKGAKVIKRFPHGRMKLAKVGTGEGHQAYGHGLYFASQKKIADWYREELSKGRGIQVLYNGKPVEFDRDRDDSAPEEIAIRNVAGAIANSDSRDSIPVEDMIRSSKWGVQRRIDYAVEWLTAGPLSPGMEAQYDKDVKILDALDRLDPSKFEHKRHKGARYNVDLKPDETEYLDWDKSYNEQSDSVKKALGSPEELVKSLGGAISTIDWFDGPVSGEDVMDWKGIPKADQDKLWRELPQWQRDAGMKEYRAEHPDSIRAEVVIRGRTHVGVAKTKQEAIAKAVDQMTGASIYHDLSAQAIRSLNYGKPSQEFASNWLLQKGIRGNRYLDGDSRHGGAGSFNFVLFDDADIAIESVLKKVAISNPLLYPADPERLNDAVVVDAGNLRNLATAMSSGPKSFGSLDVPLQNASLAGVFRLAQNLKIRDAIVRALPVDVVDLLGREQATPEVLFHDPAVFQRLLAADSDEPIPLLVNMADRLGRIPARGGAVDAPALRSVQRNGEAGFTMGTDQVGLRGGSRSVVAEGTAELRPLRVTRMALRDGVATAAASVLAHEGSISQLADFNDRDVAIESVLKKVDPQTLTPEFRNWFKDSKVVDGDGKPLVVYHGTNKSFDSFDKERIGSNAKVDKRGFFFTNDVDTAEFFAVADIEEVGQMYFLEESQGANIMPAYVKIENPVVLSDVLDLFDMEESDIYEDFDHVGEFFDDARPEILKLAQDKGADGIILKSDGFQQIVAFDPTQIKSAIGNSGAFDPNEGSILKSVALPEDLAIKPEVAEALIKVAAAKLIDDVPTGLTPTAFDKWLNEVTNNSLGAREIAVVHALAHEMTRPVFEPKDLDQKFLTKNRIAHKQRADRILIAEGLTDVTPEGIAEYKEAHKKQGPKKSEAKWGPKAGPKRPTTLAARTMALGEDLGVDEQTATMAVAQMTMPDEKRLRQIYNSKFPDGGSKGYAAAMNAGKQLVDMARDQATAEKWEAKAGEGATKKEALDLERAMKGLATEERLKRKALETQFKRLAETGTDKVLGAISSAYNLPRSVMFSGDLGFLLAQGLPTLLMHPTAWWKAVSTGIPAALTDKRFEQAITEAYNSTQRKVLEAGGTKFEQIGNIADFNDDFMSDVARHIPFVKQTNRAHSLTTDLFRLYGGSADLMELDAMYEAGKLGKDADENARNYNRSREFLAKKWTNVMSGKGYLGALDVLGKGMAQVGSAPRYTVSAFQMPYYANPLRAAFLPKGARKIMMKNSAKIWIPIIGLMLLLSKLGLINDDPEDKDFLQIDAGKLFGIEDMNINPLRALKEPVRLTVGLPLKMLYYQVTGNRDGVARIAKSYYAAFVIDSYGGMGSFWKSKLHPTLSMASMAITGKNFVGEPAGWMDIVPLPLGIKESYQAATYDRKQSILKTGADTGKIQDNWRRVLATFVGSSIGWGVNSFPGSDTTIATKQLLSMKGGPNDDPRTDEERIADGDPTSSQSQKANQIERLIREGADVLEIMQASISSGQITKKQAEQLAATLIDDLGNVEKRLGTSFTDGQKAVLMNNRQALKILDYLYTDKNLDWRKIDKALKLSTPRENYLNDRAALAAAEAIVLEAVLRGDRITDPMTTDKMVEMYKGLAPNMTVADRDEFLQRLEKKARNSNKLGKLDPEELEKVKEVIPGIGIVPRAPGTPGPVYKIQEIGSMEKALINPAVKRWSTDDWVVVLQSKLTAKDRALAEEALKKKAENARKSKTLTQEEVGRINSVLPNFKIQADSSRGSSTTKKDDRSPSKWDGQRQSENVIDQREEN